MRRAFEKYAGSLAYLEVAGADDERSVGTAFYVQDGIWLTARHVVEN